MNLTQALPRTVTHGAYICVCIRIIRMCILTIAYSLFVCRLPVAEAVRINYGVRDLCTHHDLFETLN